jgi:putative sterol carrier protein
MNLANFFEELPSKVNSDALEGKQATFHFDVDGGGQYTVALADGKMQVTQGINGEADCKVTTSLENFEKLLKGDLNPMMAMMTGKLKISNPGKMLEYAKMFGLM